MQDRSLIRLKQDQFEYVFSRRYSNGSPFFADITSTISQNFLLLKLKYFEEFYDKH